MCLCGRGWGWGRHMCVCVCVPVCVCFCVPVCILQSFMTPVEVEGEGAGVGGGWRVWSVGRGVGDGDEQGGLSGVDGCQLDTYTPCPRELWERRICNGDTGGYRGQSLFCCLPSISFRCLSSPGSPVLISVLCSPVFLCTQVHSWFYFLVVR